MFLSNFLLSRTIQIILDRIYTEKLIDTELQKRTLQKLILDCCIKTNVILTEFERVILLDFINEGVIKFYKSYVATIHLFQ